MALSFQDASRAERMGWRTNDCSELSFFVSSLGVFFLFFLSFFAFLSFFVFSLFSFFLLSYPSARLLRWPSSPGQHAYERNDSGMKAGLLWILLLKEHS